MKYSHQICTIAALWLGALGCAGSSTEAPPAASAPAPAPVKSTSLIEAVDAGDLEAVTAAVARGADVNAKDESGFTVLVNAMANGNFDVVDFLIQKGAETGLKKPDEEAPNRVLGEGLAQDELLLAAAEAGDLASVTRLVEAGANVNARSEEGFTVLVHAISGYHREVIQYLVQKGATIHP